MLGWYVPIDTRREFVDFCADIGTIAQDDCAGALIIWQHLPPAIREAAKRAAKLGAELPGQEKEFWRQFEAGLNMAIIARSNIQPQKQEGGQNSEK